MSLISNGSACITAVMIVVLAVLVLGGATVRADALIVVSRATRIGVVVRRLLVGGDEGVEQRASSRVVGKGQA